MNKLTKTPRRTHKETGKEPTNQSAIGRIQQRILRKK